jgi:hypothetical protein
MVNGLSEDLKQFLSEHISSVGQLEVLLLMRSDPERRWTAAQVSKTLYTTPEVVAEQLADLCKRGLLAAHGGSDTLYQYAPATPDLDANVATLDAAYRERRVAVITFIYSQPIEKVRTFADAFRLRRKSDP